MCQVVSVPARNVPVALALADVNCGIEGGGFGGALGSRDAKENVKIGREFGLGSTFSSVEKENVERRPDRGPFTTFAAGKPPRTASTPEPSPFNAAVDVRNRQRNPARPRRNQTPFTARPKARARPSIGSDPT
jgi:hypothetical protein